MSAFAGSGCLDSVDAAVPAPSGDEATPEHPGGFQYFVGVVGNPSIPDIRWDDEELEQIKTLGVNMVQLGIAWGHKPADEVLNLEDLDATQREKFAFRIRQAKKHGLRTMTSNEVYPFNDRSFRSDLGVRRLVQIACERKIPVLDEFDHTLYKPLYQIEDFFPGLVHEQMLGWKEMEGVVGVKEYHGFAPSTFS